MLTQPTDDGVPAEQMMVGRCQTCGTVVACQRLACRKFRESGWGNDGWFAECVKVTGAKRDGTPRTCGARVAMCIKKE